MAANWLRDSIESGHHRYSSSVLRDLSADQRRSTQMHADGGWSLGAPDRSRAPSMSCAPFIDEIFEYMSSDQLNSLVRASSRLRHESKTASACICVDLRIVFLKEQNHQAQPRPRPAISRIPDRHWRHSRTRFLRRRSTGRPHPTRGFASMSDYPTYTTLPGFVPPRTRNGPQIDADARRSRLISESAGSVAGAIALASFGR